MQRFRCVLVEQWNDGKHHVYAEMHIDEAGPWVQHADAEAAIAAARAERDAEFLRMENAWRDECGRRERAALTGANELRWMNGVTRDDSYAAGQRDMLARCVEAVYRSCGHTKFEGCAPCAHDDVAATLRTLGERGE